MAQPPIHVWMPNHPQATRARSNAGTLAPRMPKAGRQYTGKGMPYLVPAWPFRIIGTRTITLARTIVSTACHQFMPSSISDDASMYVGTQAAMATHSAAMSRRRHLRWAMVVGARSGLKYGEAEISSCGSTRTPGEAASSVFMTASYLVRGREALRSGSFRSFQGVEAGILSSAVCLPGLPGALHRRVEIFDEPPSLAGRLRGFAPAS